MSLPLDDDDEEEEEEEAAEEEDEEEDEEEEEEEEELNDGTCGGRGRPPLRCLFRDGLDSPSSSSSATPPRRVFATRPIVAHVFPWIP